MNYLFISLIKEENPFLFKSTQLGKNVTNHDLTGKVFKKHYNAKKHQESYKEEVCGGVILAVDEKDADIK